MSSSSERLRFFPGGSNASSSEGARLTGKVPDEGRAERGFGGAMVRWQSEEMKWRGGVSDWILVLARRYCCDASVIKVWR